MDLKDLLLTPIYLLLIYSFAFFIRQKVTSQLTRKFFIPALTFKIIGAIALGLVYQFYYSGGDTFNYFDQAKTLSILIKEHPISTLDLLFSNRITNSEILPYISRIYWIDSVSEFTIIVIAAIFGLISFNTYTVIAVCFACFCFSGLWAVYKTFLKELPLMHKGFAIAIFYIPSTFFWGSGLLKDTICIGALGWLFSSAYVMFGKRKISVSSLILVFLSALLLFLIKKYILLSFLPAFLVFLYLKYAQKIRDTAVKIIATPLLLFTFIFLAYFLINNFSKGDAKYDISKVAARTKINAEYLYGVSLKENGSAYYLGELDGSLIGMLKYIPSAINVSLFRPYLWEVKNPLMLLSALESSFYLFFVIFLLFKTGFFKIITLIKSNPILSFSLIFTLILAFAVGINSFNFGTLVRYKTPFLPFFTCILYFIHNRSKLRAKQSNSVKRNLSYQNQL